MKERNTISEKIGAILERRSGLVILAVLLITALLAVPMLTMPPGEEASFDPSGQVFDLQEEIDDRFPRSVHGEHYIVEARDGDVLTQRELRELYRNTKRLRQADAMGELAPSGLESQSFTITIQPALSAASSGYTASPTRSRNC